MFLRLREWARRHYPLIACVVLATCLLVYRVSSRTFWMDETAVLEYFKFSLTDFFQHYWFRPDNHPPLYYALVLLVSKLLPWSEFTVRLVSILAALGMVVVSYFLALRAVGSRAVATATAFFVSLSSYFVLIGQMARYHSLSGVAALATFYFLYQLISQGNQRRYFVCMLLSLLVTLYSDYPHGIYAIGILNLVYGIQLARRRAPMSVVRWIGGQAVVALLSLPLAWMLYHRIFIQGDGGWDNVNLLGNSSAHIILGIIFHVYTFFFGENIFPWNYVVCLLGVGTIAASGVGYIRAIRTKTLTAGEVYVVGLSIALIILNTLFMNVADRRYNFIVYPKFVFVAYPLWIMSFTIGLWHLKKRARSVALVCWCVVALAGLYNFYQRTNYLNASYFNTFRAFEYVRDQQRPGDYLALTPDAGEGSYIFYKNKYFSQLRPLAWQPFVSSTVPLGSRVWFFATGSDATGGSVATESIIPAGYTIVSRLDSVPLDPTLQYWKERVLHRPSYVYKYTVFLLTKT